MISFFQIFDFIFGYFLALLFRGGGLFLLRHLHQHNAEAEDDGEPFEKKMARLTGELAKCFEESNRLQEQIKRNLEAIGYGI